MRAIRLKTENLRNPIGIDCVRPHFLWNCESGIKQTAYQVMVCGRDRILWDSGKVQSRAMRCFYDGEALQSRDILSWSVQLWDENGEVGEPSTATFEIGLLQASDWTAKWITGNYRVHAKKRYPVDCFRKCFRAGNVAKARLYVTACGLYEGHLNGERIGNFVMAPGYTDYKKRIQYQTYDVTAQVRDGKNVMTFSLADGWYRGSVGAWGLRNQYGTETRLLAQLEITAKDGTVTTIGTDGSWGWSNDGPIRFADNKDGEVVEAGRIPTYQGVAKETFCPVVPTASNNVSVTEHETFTPAVITTPSGKKVLDFGQNLAGILQFRLEAKPGQQVFLRFGEMLDENGEFTQKNIQCSTKRKTTPLQQVLYTCKEGINAYKMSFAVFGFQYVLLETEAVWKPEDFTAIAVYSDLERTGYFECSNDLLNRFVENTIWSTKNNFLDIPTDCPTRERHGWTGDIQIFYKTAAYLFDCNAFIRKYLQDVYDWQRKDGCLPQIAPYGGTDFYMYTMNGSVGWSDVGILIPYRMWKLQGDRTILEQHYDGMKAFAEFMIQRCGFHISPMSVYAKPTHVKGAAKKYVVNYGQSYGEWAEPEDVHSMSWKDMVSPHPEVSTAYTSYVLGLLAEIAGELGKKEDEKRFGFYSEKCREGYQALRHTAQYGLDTDRQAELVRPLYMKLLNEEDTVYAGARLLEALEKYGWRLGTGFLSTPLILYVLSELDPEAAYKLLENEEMPGWLFMPKNGATTIWESWEGTSGQGGIASLNHYSKGACVEWLFTTMCGIQVCGENHFLIAPKPGGHIAYAKACYNSIYGMVESSWTREDGKIFYHFRIPPNCEAEISVPFGDTVTVGSGNYTFEGA